MLCCCMLVGLEQGQGICISSTFAGEVEVASLESALEEPPLFQGDSQSWPPIGISRGTSKNTSTWASPPYI